MREAEVRSVVGERKIPSGTFRPSGTRRSTSSWKKMDLQLPPDTEEFRVKPLRKSDLRFLKRVLLKTEAVSDRYVRPLVATNDPPEENPKVTRLVEALRSD